MSALGFPLHPGKQDTNKDAPKMEGQRESAKPMATQRRLPRRPLSVLFDNGDETNTYQLRKNEKTSESSLLLSPHEERSEGQSGPQESCRRTNKSNILPLCTAHSRPRVPGRSLSGLCQRGACAQPELMPASHQDHTLKGSPRNGNDSKNRTKAPTGPNGTHGFMCEYPPR